MKGQNHIRSRKVWIDLAKIVACIAVILLHASIPGVFAHFSAGPLSWWSATSLNAATRFAVPLFIMLSGASKVSTQNKITSRKLKKNSIALLLTACVWIAVYAAADYLLFGTAVEPLKLFRDVIFNEQYRHLYFLFAIAQLWLITPALKELLHQLKPTSQLHLWVFATMLTLFWQPRLFIGTTWIPFVSYFLGGGLLEQHWGKIHNHRKIISENKALLFLLFLLTSLIAAIGTYVLTRNGVTHNLYFLGHHSITTVVSTYVCFVLFRSLAPELEKLSSHIRQLASQIAQLTLGVYLIAPLVSDLLLLAIGLYIDTRHIQSVLFMAYATTVCSFAAVWLYKNGTEYFAAKYHS